jgi:hypothetical protein
MTPDAERIAEKVRRIINSMPPISGCGGSVTGVAYGRYGTGDRLVSVELALVHEDAEPGPAGTELIGRLPPDASGALLVGLPEGLTERGGDHGLLTFRNVSQGASHPMHDPNASDVLRFSVSLAFLWPSIAKPRRRRPQPG